MSIEVYLDEACTKLLGPSVTFLGTEALDPSYRQYQMPVGVVPIGVFKEYTGYFTAAQFTVDAGIVTLGAEIPAVYPSERLMFFHDHSAVGVLTAITADTTVAGAVVPLWLKRGIGVTTTLKDVNFWCGRTGETMLTPQNTGSVVIDVSPRYGWNPYNTTISGLDPTIIGTNRLYYYACFINGKFMGYVINSFQDVSLIKIQLDRIISHVWVSGDEIFFAKVESTRLVAKDAVTPVFDKVCTVGDIDDLQPIAKVLIDLSDITVYQYPMWYPYWDIAVMYTPE